MLTQGVVQPWASPVVLVRKKDGLKLGGFPFQGLMTPSISFLLASGYWLDPASKENTAFTTYSGLYEFRNGLVNAPAMFQSDGGCVVWTGPR